MPPRQPMFLPLPTQHSIPASDASPIAPLPCAGQKIGREYTRAMMLIHVDFLWLFLFYFSATILQLRSAILAFSASVQACPPF
jgi:hypothetical protein